MQEYVYLKVKKENLKDIPPLKIVEEINTNFVYDNGEMVLGNVYNLKDYLCRNCEDYEEIKEIIEDLEDLDEDTIVALNYDNGMGYSMDYWRKDTKVEI